MNRTNSHTFAPLPAQKMSIPHMLQMVTYKENAFCQKLRKNQQDRPHLVVVVVSGFKGPSRNISHKFEGLTAHWSNYGLYMGCVKNF